jgi:hypothetical protein
MLPVRQGQTVGQALNQWDDPLSGCLIPAVAMSAITKDIGGFCLPFAIRSAIIAVLSCRALATWMGALLCGFHTGAASI